MDDADLDRLLNNASDDLDQVWRTRMLARFRADAETRGDEQTLAVLDKMTTEEA